MQKSILRRVGLVLLVTSLLQFAWAIYWSQTNHGFSLDLTIPVAGIALISGSSSAAHFIRRFAAFGLAVMLCLAVDSLATEPPSLILTRLHLQTLLTVGDAVIAAVFIVVLAWTVHALSRPEIMADAAGQSWAWITPRLAFAGGIACSAFLALVTLPSNAMAHRAVRDASTQLGPSFQYHLSAIDIHDENGTRHISGTVTAWNALTIVDLPFAWDE